VVSNWELKVSVAINLPGLAQQTKSGWTSPLLPISTIGLLLTFMLSFKSFYALLCCKEKRYKNKSEIDTCPLLMRSCFLMKVILKFIKNYLII